MEHQTHSNESTIDTGRAAGAAPDSWAIVNGVPAHGEALGLFAEAVGHVALLRAPNLFGRSLLGTWPDMTTFVDSYITEVGLIEHLDVLPPRVRQLATIDRGKVIDELQRELLILTTEDRRVWVFDPPRRGHIAVAKRERRAHNGWSNGDPHDNQQQSTQDPRHRNQSRT